MKALYKMQSKVIFAVDKLINGFVTGTQPLNTFSYSHWLRVQDEIGSWMSHPRYLDAVLRSSHIQVILILLSLMLTTLP